MEQSLAVLVRLSLYHKPLPCDAHQRLGTRSGERSPAGVAGACGPRETLRISWSGTAPPNQPTGTVTETSTMMTAMASRVWSCDTPRVVMRHAACGHAARRVWSCGAPRVVMRHAARDHAARRVWSCGAPRVVMLSGAKHLPDRIRSCAARRRPCAPALPPLRMTDNDGGMKARLY